MTDTRGLIQTRLKDALSVFFASRPFFQSPGQVRVYEEFQAMEIELLQGINHPLNSEFVKALARVAIEEWLDTNLETAKLQIG